MKPVLCALLGAVMLMVWGCEKDAPMVTPPLSDFEKNVQPWLTIGEEVPDYAVHLPDYSSGFLPASVSVAEKAQLGRVIFYDKKLSKDGTVSCASCHIAAFGFSDPAALSTGVQGRKTKRNSMSLLNTMWFGGYLGIDAEGDALLPLFWDLRAHSVAAQSKAAFTNENEMGVTMDEVTQSMALQPYYHWLFKAAWGDSLVTEQRIFESLSHFMTAMSVTNTTFDQALVKAGGIQMLENDFSVFTPEQNRGKQLYVKHCLSCHGSLATPPLIFEANNGLESPYTDPGKGGISGYFYDKGIFKVPGLRNIGFTAPYMHDGRFATLAQVVEHYNSGVKQVFGLHGDLLMFNEATQTYSAQRLHLSESDKEAIVAFLHTMDDPGSLTKEQFMDPFK